MTVVLVLELRTVLAASTALVVLAICAVVLRSSVRAIRPSGGPAVVTARVTARRWNAVERAALAVLFTSRLFLLVGVAALIAVPTHVVYSWHAAASRSFVVKTVVGDIGVILALLAVVSFAVALAAARADLVMETLALSVAGVALSLLADTDPRDLPRLAVVVVLVAASFGFLWVRTSVMGRRRGSRRFLDLGWTDDATDDLFQDIGMS